MQTELLDRRKWVTIVELSTKMAAHIDTIHNRQRLHSSLDMVTTTEYEDLNASTLQLMCAR